MPSNPDMTRASAGIARLEAGSATYRLDRHPTPFGELTAEVGILPYHSRTMKIFFEAGSFALEHTAILLQPLLVFGRTQWSSPQATPATLTSGDTPPPDTSTSFAWRLSIQTTQPWRLSPSVGALSEWQARAVQSVKEIELIARLYAPQVRKPESSLHVLTAWPATAPHLVGDQVSSSVYMALQLAYAYIKSYEEALYHEGMATV